MIRGEEGPLVSGREGLETLRVIEAVKLSAATGRPIRLDRPIENILDAAPGQPEYNATSRL